MENNNVALMPAEETYARALDMAQGGALILTTIQAKVSQIVNSGQNIINNIQANGGQLTPDLDKLCNDYIAKANTRLREMKESREPVTQMLTAVQKLFTTEEAKLDSKKPDTVISIIQSFRNGYARQVAEEQRKRQEEADRNARKGQEAIQLKANSESQLNAYFNQKLLADKQALQNRFNGLLLDTFTANVEKLRDYVPAYSYQHFMAFQPSLFPSQHSKEEVAAIVSRILNGGFEPFAERYRSELGELRDQLLVRVPSKHKELLALKEADDEEKQRIAADQIKREKEEADRLKLESEQAQQRAEMNIHSTAAAEETMVIFEKEAELTVDTPQPEARQGYEIEILGAAGYVQIFQLWWENEGKTQEPEKIEKKTIGSMKKFCESLAHKKDVKIESKFLRYHPSYKAVNRKTKDE